MKKNTQTTFGLMLTLCIALGIATFVIYTNRFESVSAMSNDLPKLQNYATDNTQQQEEQPIVALSKDKFPIAKIKSNIKIELLNVQLDAGFLYADICFDFPSDNPAWSLGDPTNLKLSNGVAEIGVYSIELIPDSKTGELKKDDKGKYIGRCDHVGFPLSDGFALENLKVSIGKLVTDMPDSPDCNKAQAKLDSKNSGIKIKCINEPGRSGVEAVVKPKDMDDVQAQKLITDVLTESVDGPWEFEIGAP